MNKRFMVKKISVLIGFLLIFVINLSIGTAISNSPFFYWDRIDVDIDLQTNGDMLVTEIQSYVFDQNYTGTNERYRYIPLERVDRISEVTVKENDLIIPSNTSINDDLLMITWEHQLKLPDKHTFVLTYRVIGGLQVDSKNISVYWKAIFADLQAPVQNAKIRIRLPKELSDRVVSFKNFGTEAIARQVDATTFEFISNQHILPQKELEVRVVFPASILTISQPQWQQFSIFDWIKPFFPFLIRIMPFVIAVFFGGSGGGDGGGGGGGGGG